MPTCRAPVVPLHDGLVANSQNCWPSVKFDVGRLIDKTQFLWPAGFYNKTFKWPDWHSWEGLIRKTAGLGRPLTGPDPDSYEQVNAHCDLLVCGGGATGLVAALTAGKAGLRVILADQAEAFGGVLNWESIELNGKPASDWVSTIIAELKSLPNVMLLPRTTVTGIYDHNVTSLLQAGQDRAWRECFWTIRPRHILLATGAIEQGLIFPGNDRPGIMLAGAARHYLNRYAVQVGEKVVISTNNDSAYQTAFDFHRRGVRVDTVVDVRPEINQSIRNRLNDMGTRILLSARIRDTRGDLSLIHI